MFLCYLCENMDKINPKTLKKIYKLLTVGKNKPTLNELKKRFCPNTKEYENKILVRMFYFFDDSQTTFQRNELININDFRNIDWNEKINLGSVNGKNSKVCLTLNDIIYDIIEDPYVIYTFEEKYKDILIKENGYLHDIVQQNKSSELSEETSDEETDNDTDGDTD